MSGGNFQSSLAMLGMSLLGLLFSAGFVWLALNVEGEGTMTTWHRMTRPGASAVIELLPKTGEQALLLLFGGVFLLCGLFFLVYAIGFSKSGIRDLFIPPGGETPRGGAAPRRPRRRRTPRAQTSGSGDDA